MKKYLCLYAFILVTFCTFISCSNRDEDDVVKQTDSSFIKKHLLGIWKTSFLYDDWTYIKLDADGTLEYNEQYDFIESYHKAFWIFDEDEHIISIYSENGEEAFTLKIVMSDNGNSWAGYTLNGTSTYSFFRIATYEEMMTSECAVLGSLTFSPDSCKGITTATISIESHGFNCVLADIVMIHDEDTIIINDWKESEDKRNIVFDVNVSKFEGTCTFAVYADVKLLNLETNKVENAKSNTIYADITILQQPLSGQWTGNFGMFYDYEYRGQIYTFNSYDTDIVFYPDYNYATHGYGYEVDFYNEGPRTKMSFRFFWKINGGNIYLDYPGRSEKNTTIRDYSLDRYYFTGCFENGTQQFSLRKMADFYNWNDYSGYDYRYWDNPDWNWDSYIK